LLVFVGNERHNQQYLLREDTLEQLNAANNSSSIKPDHRLFKQPYIKELFHFESIAHHERGAKPLVDLLVTSWQNYASSVFSWQPAGDTPTRR